MYGLEAVIRYNGFEMASIGCFIVFFGLCLLSFLIYQFHCILFFFEKKNNKNARKESIKKILNSVKVDFFFEDIRVVSNIYMLFSKQLNNRFRLSDLYWLARDNDFIHPHISIRNLRMNGILIPLGSGYFSWKKSD